MCLKDHTIPGLINKVLMLFTVLNFIPITEAADTQNTIGRCKVYDTVSTVSIVVKI